MTVTGGGLVRIYIYIYKYIYIYIYIRTCMRQHFVYVGRVAVTCQHAHALACVTCCSQPELGDASSVDSSTPTPEVNAMFRAWNCMTVFDLVPLDIH